MPPAKPRAPVRSRRPFRDNPPLILAGIVILLAGLGGMVWLADRTSTLSPDFLTEVVLYALYATNITMLVALGFVLARNVIKSVFDGRSGLPLGRFRAKLVLAFLGLTVIPAVLVLIVGSRVVLTAVDRWFNTPMEEILAGANSIAADYYQERERLVTEQASRLARELGRVDLSTADMTRVQSMVTPEVTGPRVAVVQVYRVDRLPGQPLAVVSLVDVASPSMPQGWARGSAERLAGGAATGRETTSVLEQLAAGGDLLHVGEAVKNAGGQVTGVVVVSEYLSGERAERSRRMTKAYEDYTQLQVLKQPLAGVYVSFFVMVTLLILVGSTWMGLYLAKRITRPVQMLSEAAKAIGAGHYDRRIEYEGSDEFGAMVEAVRLGRRIVDNLRKALCYVIGVHVPIAGMALLPLFAGTPLVLTPALVMFLEMIINPASSIVFESEHGERDLMLRPPRKPGEALFGARAITYALVQGLGLLLACMATFFITTAQGSAHEQARAAVFITMVLGNLAMILVSRSNYTGLLSLLAKPNPAQWWLVGVSLVAFVLVVGVPWLAESFSFGMPDLAQIGVALLAALAALSWLEMVKFIFSRRTRSVKP